MNVTSERPKDKINKGHLKLWIITWLNSDGACGELSQQQVLMPLLISYVFIEMTEEILKPGKKSGEKVLHKHFSTRIETAG